MNLRQIYKVTLKRGFGGPIRVFAFDEAEAKKNAFSAYTFCSMQKYHNPEIDDIVAMVEPDDGGMRGVWIQPSVQDADYHRPRMVEILKEQF